MNKSHNSISFSSIQLYTQFFEFKYPIQYLSSTLTFLYIFKNCIRLYIYSLNHIIIKSKTIIRCLGSNRKSGGNRPPWIICYLSPQSYTPFLIILFTNHPASSSFILKIQLVNTHIKNDRILKFLSKISDNFEIYAPRF
jgi:hypothetical protein